MIHESMCEQIDQEEFCFCEDHQNCRVITYSAPHLIIQDAIKVMHNSFYTSLVPMRVICITRTLKSPLCCNVVSIPEFVAKEDTLTVLINSELPLIFLKKLTTG